MAFAPSHTAGPTCVNSSSRRCTVPRGVIGHRPVHATHAAALQNCGSVISKPVTVPRQQSSSNGHDPLTRAGTRSVRAHVAAQATVTLDDTVIEFLGVNNGMQTVRGVLHVAADADLVYDMLTDYDRCARVFRNIVTSETKLFDDGSKQVLQACQWQVSGLKGNFNVTLNVDEQPSARQLVFTLQESSFMNDFEGRWQIEAAPGGGCYIEHTLAVKPVMRIPRYIAPYTSTIFKQQVGNLLQDLKHAIDAELEALATAN